MMNEKQQKLRELLEKNEKVGTAIAITGSWGVGKTYFWNKFRDEYPLKKKYVYVSLFGLESLSDLKTHIYSNIENNHSALEVPKWIRGLPSILKDTRLSQFGINASAKVFDSLMFNQVKDAVICLDDFERMSNKLDIKDVMGLANQLKLEKNCQIILILDETKTENSNKEKYAEYKEKLIDSTIKITSVEPLIRENAKDMDKPLVDLMVKFADELTINNFRFFQKVIILYKQFIENLPDKVTLSIKKRILVLILVGYFLELFGQNQSFNWAEIKKNEDNLNNKQQIIYRKLKNISYEAVNVDPLFLEFEKIFQQVGSYDSMILTDITKKDFLLQDNFDKNQKLDSLTQEYYKKIFTKNDLDNLMKLIENNVSLFSGYQIKKVIEFLSDENKEKVISSIKPYIEILFTEGKKTKDQLKEEYGQDFETYISILNKPKLDTINDDKANVLNKVINSGFDPRTSDPQILESFSKNDWNQFLGESRYKIFSDKYAFNNFNNVLKSARFLNENQMISENVLKKIEDYFISILNDLKNEIDENEPQELKFRLDHWKKKLGLDQDL